MPDVMEGLGNVLEMQGRPEEAEGMRSRMREALEVREAREVRDVQLAREARLMREVQISQYLG
ncbi:hypothetical protein GGP41_003687 [Bipolaris sorokiniana]|nr:hypothetical protein GGP41_003687 [Bipolaris sorokiniana]